MFRILFLAVSLLVLSACGGGSSGKSYSISLDKNQLNYVTEFQQWVVARVTVDYQGDGVLVGVPPGQSLPGWINIRTISNTTGRAVFDIEMYGESYSGSYSQTLRFVTGSADDASTATYKDLRVNLRSVAPVEFATMLGQSEAPAARVLELSATQFAENYNVQVEYGSSSESDWLEVTKGSSSFEAQVSRLDVPTGNYSARVLFVLGTSIQAERIVSLNVTEPALEVAPISAKVIDETTQVSDLSFTANASNNSSVLTWRVGEFSELLEVSKASDEQGIDVSVKLDGLDSLANGEYDGWFDIISSHPYSAGETTTRYTFDLTVDFAGVEHVSPKVVYTGRSQKVLVAGANLAAIDDATFLASQAITAIERISDSQVELTTNASAAVGNYPFEVANQLGINRVTGELVVKSDPIFPIGEVSLPKPAYQVIYDAQREQFYFPGNWEDSYVYRVFNDGNTWQYATYEIDRPAGIALTRDGSKLIVGTYDCAVKEIDLTTNVVEDGQQLDGCYYNEFGFIGQFYTGLTVIADTNQWPSMWQYPSWTGVPFNVPSEHSPIGMISDYGTHMIWAGAPTTTGDRTAYIYNAKTNEMTPWSTQAGDYYLMYLFSMSARGERFIHDRDLYDENLAYVGSIGSTTDALSIAGLSPDGSRAALFDYETKTVSIYDTSLNSGEIVDLNIELSVADARATRILFSEDNQYLFVFSTNVDRTSGKLSVFAL
ncbi:hypothetical protein [Pleionea litopenaei]|uniref:Uncharacterized protein n=1 Tax=Pleionea litopenaei TaxID=3070815 RepID=A0AA51RSQ9_9GAMM|nr:hypothetical protein [Pleionea sp. HL-JVS1]WMS86779.1 hypothetical protein Q9312_16275 [Pleionea sp. HL-JVS1]